MKNSKKSWNVFKSILIILFIIFIISYFQVESGSYNSSLSDKTILTEENIRQFEEDVKNGEYVDIKKYTVEEVDTSNYMSDLGYEIGEGIDSFINDKVVNVLNFIGNLFK